MAGSFPVSVKHGQKKYDLQLDTSQPPSAFKQAIYQLTGVAPIQQKILVKGGQLKDESDWSKLAIKPGHQFMLIGTAGELPPPPTQQTIFVEDLTETELAEADPFPAGLENLGNTCYLNSTVQVLRAIPELQTNLTKYTRAADPSRNDVALTCSLRDTYQDLTKSSDGYSPFNLIATLRSYAPQFAQQTQGHYAQQDAEECWVQLLSAVRSTLDSSVGTDGKFVERYLTGELETETKCTEAPEEPPTISKEKWLELKCNISISTNYMITGIQDGLKQPLEKLSPSLGRSAQYLQTSKISRLPAYLAIHMVRFYWRRDINKKTKIMRKVKFPFNLDLTDLLSDKLKSQVGPAASKLKDIEKDRRERIKIQKKKKIAKEESSKNQMAIDQQPNGAGAASTSSAPPPTEEKPIEGAQEEEEEDEATIREREAAVLMSLMDPELVNDVGTNPTAQYELCGIVTHKGASADGGHYMAWVRCDAAKANPNLPQPSTSEPSSSTKKLEHQDPDDQEWYKFDDEKVSVVHKDKILGLDGGGEDSIAYILLYRPTKI
ncbi:deubiquitinating enzyme [Puccinia graminis f. sp. tritici]|uniref:Ubiquitin carboxyl-terminal hydrolase n=1 Tax=Puccinia graminis f. sp. tritici TaxID=56615 RepID=A0A5B0PVA5_PUCGR|nr:deubiquitinating enzyme [Puccinia graminis f. sp. tritici]